MALQRESLAQLRAQARQARAHGQFAQAARLERRAVDAAAAAGSMAEHTRALLWEGYSLSLAGETDLALAALLQAVNERAMTADPADSFSALIAIVHISLDRKPASFSRTLLEQGRNYLSAIQQPWTALLDHLEGELAYRRGDFEAAWLCHERAWAGRREAHPRLTPVTHLWALCRSAFRRRDQQELEGLVNMLNALSPVQALEHAMVQRAHGLLWRAQRATLPASALSPAPIVAARALLDENGDLLRGMHGAKLEAVRVLALAGDWQAIDHALSQSPLSDDSFDTLLLLGDLALNRAQALLNRPLVDLDYAETFALLPAACATPAFVTPSADAATEALNAAHYAYQRLQQAAMREDARLDTQWYHRIVDARVAALALMGSMLSVSETT